MIEVLPRRPIGAWVALAFALFFCSGMRTAFAQCTSNASSCVSCHEAQGLRPVLQDQRAWHADHGFGDLCASCHAGDPAATDQTGAHQGLRDPLSREANACVDCHASDSEERRERYLALSRTTPPSPPAATPPTATPSPWANRVLAGISALLAMVLFGLVRRARWTLPRMTLPNPRTALWSPYLTGALLGIVVAVSEVFCGRPVAAAGAFDKLAAYLGRALFPQSQYYAHVMSPGITWQVWLIVGLVAGSFAASLLAKEVRPRFLPDTQWEDHFGPSRARRIVVAFLGAVLVQVGAGIAGGCTSGLAISGGAALAPAAFVFMAGMFAGGIPTAWLWYRGEKRR